MVVDSTHTGHAVTWIRHSGYATKEATFGCHQVTLAEPTAVVPHDPRVLEHETRHLPQTAGSRCSWDVPRAGRTAGWSIISGHCGPPAARRDCTRPHQTALLSSAYRWRRTLSQEHAKGGSRIPRERDYDLPALPPSTASAAEHKGPQAVQCRMAGLQRKGHGRAPNEWGARPLRGRGRRLHGFKAPTRKPMMTQANGYRPWYEGPEQPASVATDRVGGRPPGASRLSTTCRRGQASARCARGALGVPCLPGYHGPGPHPGPQTRGLV
jgi:hypothetical protein